MEDFNLLERDTGKVLWSLPRQHNLHYFTLETDYYNSPQQQEEELDWCVTNINDVVRPALSTRFQAHDDEGHKHTAGAK